MGSHLLIGGVGPPCISHTAGHLSTHAGLPLVERSTFGSRRSRRDEVKSSVLQHLCLLQRQISTNVSFNGPNWKFIFQSLVWPLLDALLLLLLMFFLKAGRVFPSLHWESQSHFLL